VSEVRRQRGGMTMEFNAAIAVRQYVKRKAHNAEKKMIDNASLHAGSPMYYYCDFCCDDTQTLPESHTCAPKTVCDPCKMLRDHGIIDNRGSVV